MGQVNILDVPRRGFLCISADGLPEKCQFESVVMTVGGFQISGVIPPFGLKVGMIEIVSGKFEMIAGHGSTILRSQRGEEKEQRGEGCKATLHERPQGD